MTYVRAGCTLVLTLLFVAMPGRELAAQSPAAPTGQELEELTSEVASQLRCPVCRQLSIEDSQAKLSREVKDLIREKLAAGESPEEVKAYFVSKYGEWILLAPPKRGFTLLVWVLPVVGLLGGGVVLVRLFKGWLGAGDSERVESEAVRPVPDL